MVSDDLGGYHYDAQDGLDGAADLADLFLRTLQRKHKQNTCLACGHAAHRYGSECMEPACHCYNEPKDRMVEGI